MRVNSPSKRIAMAQIVDASLASSPPSKDREKRNSFSLPALECFNSQLPMNNRSKDANIAPTRSLKLLQMKNVEMNVEIHIYSYVINALNLIEKPAK
jgi:hypothetical protein